MSVVETRPEAVPDLDLLVDRLGDLPDRRLLRFERGKLVPRAIRHCRRTSTPPPESSLKRASPRGCEPCDAISP